jgi:hypothetical protein
MMTTLADVRSDVTTLLAGAVDSLTWTTTLLDAAIRLALAEVDGVLIYESDFTVSVTGREQDLSAVPDLLGVLALAYPWPGSMACGADFAQRLVAWRSVGHGRVILDRWEPQIGEVIRVRHTQRHTLADLDGAAATTVPEIYRPLLGLAAAAWVCDLRRRQLSENPAAPRDAAALLDRLAATYRGEFARRLTPQLQPAPAWPSLGL